MSSGEVVEIPILVGRESEMNPPFLLINGAKLT